MLKKSATQPMPSERRMMLKVAQCTISEDYKLELIPTITLSQLPRFCASILP
jgi:hypothetical protein